MAQIIDPMATLQSYQTANALNALRQQQMELSRMQEARASAMHPLEMQSANMNMLVKRAALEEDQRRRNALMQFGATGNMNALAQADPAAFAKYKLGREELRMKQGQPAKPIWDSARGVFVMPPQPGMGGMAAGNGGRSVPGIAGGMIPTDRGMAGAPGGAGVIRPAGLPPSKDELKAQKETEKEKSRLDAALSKANTVLTAAGEALSQSGPMTTGLVGDMRRTAAGRLTGSGAYDLARTVDTIKANLGFNELQAMRDASPTGGALGQVAVQELNMLQATLANLDPGQSEEQLNRNLRKIQTHYMNWKQAVMKAKGGGSDDGWTVEEVNK